MLQTGREAALTNIPNILSLPPVPMSSNIIYNSTLTVQPAIHSMDSML